MLGSQKILKPEAARTFGFYINSLFSDLELYKLDFITAKTTNIFRTRLTKAAFISLLIQIAFKQL